MSSHQLAAADPILAMLPEVRGRRILRPCVLYARLGRGGMGAVYLGKHLTLMQKQVVKCLWLMGSGNPVAGEAGNAFVDRFQQEARIAAEMTHQNLVRVTHVDRLGELHYLVMEYIAGEDLDRRIKRAGPMAEEVALAALLGAAQGLGYAHARGVVHRDVKPANLMISAHGEMKVIDLGLARAIDSTRQLGATVGTLGTPMYMAPEQWEGGNVGPTADVWALGAVLHFLLTGRSHLPAGMNDASEIRRYVSAQPFVEPIDSGLRLGRAARRILRRCTARDPAERYADARELVNELAELVTAEDPRLIDAAGVQVVDGEEPHDEELRQLQEALAREESGEATLPYQSLDLTRPMPNADRTVPQHAGALPFAAGRGGTTPAPISSPRPSRPLQRRRRSSWAGKAAALSVLALGASAGVVWWPRVDYEAIQKEAMAAIYQERFEAADQLLRELERGPAFADQARRLRIDALVRHALRSGAADPVAALVRLGEAAAVARELLIRRDTEDALARIVAARAPLEASLQAAMVACLTVQSPLAGSVITRGRQAVNVRLVPGALELQLSVQERAFTKQSEDLWTAEWEVPEHDGEATISLVLAEPKTGLQQVVTVPVVIKRGAMALRLDAPAAVCNRDGFRCGGTVDNGPLQVRCEVTAPDGSQSVIDLGEHNDAFAFEVPFPPGADGSYSLRLLAQAGAEPLASQPFAVRVDRQVPRLMIDAGTRHVATQSLIVRGFANEPCRIFVLGREEMAVQSEADGAFALPLSVPKDEGTTTLVLQARDLAGNENLEAATFAVEVDRTPPHVVGAAQTSARTAGLEVPIRGQLSEPGEVSVDQGVPAPTAADGAFEVVAVLPPGLMEQQVTLRLSARDRAGNVGEPVAVTTFVDRVGPTILPGAPDGSWWAGGNWLLKVEDPCSPCQVTLGGETQDVGPDGLVRFVRRVDANGVVATARDALGNQSTRAISGPGMVEVANVPLPGPTWGTPAAGAAVDPQLHLYERVSVAIGTETIVMRLVRPLRDEELPPSELRDARAVALLQGQPPFYLAETEVPVAVWAQYVAMADGAAAPGGGFRFDPVKCQWTPQPDADWRAPLHTTLLSAATVEDRARWPVSQVTPAAARAFCARFGLRLPTELEWWFVVRMGARSRYGWLPAGPLEARANLADLALKAKVPNLAAFEPENDGFAALAGVDVFPQPSQQHPWGFHGLLGNVAEWCTIAGDRVVARGGSWLSEPRELRVDELPKDRAISSGAWDTVGFRVARDL